jgi:RNA polymerase sigma-70 factor, ECF subfamily
VHPTETRHDDQRDQAFRTYVVPELEVLYGVAMRLTRDPHDAEDVVQETLLRAYRAIDRFDGRYPRAWLLTILRNANINRARKRTPDLLRDEQRTLGRLPGRGADGRDGAAEPALDRIPDDTIVDALRRLSEDHRAVVTLVDIDGLSYREAAEILEIPIGTVMSRLHRARNKLRTRLERAGYLDGTPPS